MYDELNGDAAPALCVCDHLHLICSLSERHSVLFEISVNSRGCCSKSHAAECALATAAITESNSLHSAGVHTQLVLQPWWRL